MRKIKRLDIKISFNCNNHCLFCAQGQKRVFLKEKKNFSLKKILDEARKECSDVVFTGGEPTLREDIIDLVGFAKKKGYKIIQIQTNGRMFAYEKFCREVISAGANEFSPALHGHVPELHDYLTSSKGSFEQTVKGISNLKKFGARVISNTVITKSNFRHLPEIAALLVFLKVDQYQFAFVHAVGSAKKNFSAIVPRKSLVESYVKQGLDIGIKNGIKGMTEAIPFCFMKGYESCVSERIIPQTKIYDHNTIIDNFTLVRQKEGKTKHKNCRICLYDKICEGPWKEYPEEYGWKEFVPVRQL